MVTLSAIKVRPTASDMMPKNPLVQALESAEYGRLTIITPEGIQYEMGGKTDYPVAHWHIHDWKILPDIVARGEIGFAESYIHDQWDSNDLAALVEFMLLNASSLEKFFHGKPLYSFWLLVTNWFQRNSLRGSRNNIKAHYDLGNDFYALWLDKGMTYSCALFENDASRTLEQAQEAKYRRIIHKLNAQPGDNILEIGCGWGGFAEMAARSGLKVTAITLSVEQAEFARNRIKAAGLESLANMELVDYREIKGQFDHIVSIGMFEHVGKNYWPTYFNTIKTLLKPGGRAMVQSITLDDVLFETLGNTTGFIEKYIFPGGMLPSKTRFREAATNAGLECRELFAFGLDYARTLTCWLERFENHLAEVKTQGYDEPFIRLWRFYLCSCIAAFTSKRTDVMQAELTHA